jgi:hypothetical protein
MKVEHLVETKPALPNAENEVYCKACNQVGMIHCHDPISCCPLK